MNKKLLIFVIIGFLLSLLIFGATLYFTVFKNSSEKKVEEIKTFNYDAGEFTTNVGDGHFFKGNITIETTDEKEIAKLTEKNAEIRDSILEVIMSQDPDNMTNKEGLAKVKKEIIQKLSKAINSNTLRNIFFTNYVIQ